MKERPCVFCGVLMEPALDDWATLQPRGGGEVRFVFAYGSCQFDDNVYPTEFRGIICDECAAKYVGKMDKTCEGVPA